MPYNCIIFDSLNIPIPVHLEPWFSKCRSWRAKPASPGNALEIQILKPHPRCTKAETQEVGLSNLCCNQRKGRITGLEGKAPVHWKHLLNERENSLITHQIIPSNRLWITRCDWVTTISNVTWVQPNCKRRKRVNFTYLFTLKGTSNNRQYQIENCWETGRKDNCSY